MILTSGVTSSTLREMWTLLSLVSGLEIRDSTLNRLSTQGHHRDCLLRLSPVNSNKLDNIINGVLGGKSDVEMEE